ncbi:pyruvate phosphate dikinase 2 [Phtheirospermum japonicum]|uniref:Pyruvate phosphate dikinase 2 n=1 Tax=Phtheirospermum japonicum TaxID=374723 RepID=A0A830BAI1_9LAMI|nr:pyruvate phosphate dikinase 2 [Phtheirospermum japonicum]
MDVTVQDGKANMCGCFEDLHGHAKGLPASPSTEVGQVVFSAEDAESWHAQGKSVILVRIFKTRKEAKRMAMMESISTIKARVEELNRLVEDQRERKDEYAAIISQQFEGSTTGSAGTTKSYGYGTEMDT